MMQVFDEQSKTKGIPSKFGLHGQHSWEEVLEAAALAEEKYITDGKGKKGAGRKFFRKAGDYAPAMTPWLGLLPSDKYFSVLCGGLKLLLQVGNLAFAPMPSSYTLTPLRLLLVEAIYDCRS